MQAVIEGFKKLSKKMKIALAVSLTMTVIFGTFFAVQFNCYANIMTLSWGIVVPHSYKTVTDINTGSSFESADGTRYHVFAYRDAQTLDRIDVTWLNADDYGPLSEQEALSYFDVLHLSASMLPDYETLEHAVMTKDNGSVLLLWCDRDTGYLYVLEHLLK